MIYFVKFSVILFAAIEQPYSGEDIIMNNAHVVLDNSVILACSVPAHLSDYIFVVSWRVEDLDNSEPVELKKSNSYGSVPDLHGRSRYVSGLLKRLCPVMQQLIFVSLVLSYWSRIQRFMG